MTAASGILDNIKGITSPIIQQFFRIESGGLFKSLVIPKALISSLPRYKGSDNRNLCKYIK
jgi:hypothetical protein